MSCPYALELDSDLVYVSDASSLPEDQFFVMRSQLAIATQTIDDLSTRTIDLQNEIARLQAELEQERRYATRLAFLLTERSKDQNTMSLASQLTKKLHKRRTTTQ